MFTHPTGIATVCLSGSLDEKLAAISKAGYDEVEIFEDDVLRYPNPISTIRSSCEELGLKIAMYQPFRDLEGCNSRTDFENSLKRLEKKFDWMDELGTDLILVVSNCQPNAKNDRDAWISDFREAADRAALRNKRIAYEALAWGTHVNLWSHSWDVVKAVDRPNFGLCLDTFHIFSRGDSVDEIANIPKEKIFIVQLADAPYYKMDILEWSRHYRNFPLQGEMPVLDFMQALKKTGYEGLLSLEVFSDNFRDAPTLEVAIDGIRSLRALQVGLYDEPEISKVPQCFGIEFIEFSVQHESPILESYIEMLGFVRVGSHRTKNVQWFNNGRVSLVLNGEKESGGAEFYAQHGVAACALAVRVDNAPSTIARASKLGYEIFSTKKLGLDEATIEAVKAPDGTLIYIVDTDSFWGMDFVAKTTTTPSKDFYTGVDCIAAALSPVGVESFILFYRSLFGIEPSRQIDVHDLYGLTKSWSMTKKNHPLRFLITASHSHGSNVGRVMEASSGPALHSVSFHATDIFDVLDSIESGSPGAFCAVPASYYEDLRFRFNLPQNFVDLLQSRNVLYEKAESGTFLSAFTPPFVGKFYFQVVQRFDNYDQVGVANLAHQMAVHHTLLKNGNLHFNKVPKENGFSSRTALGKVMKNGALHAGIKGIGTAA